MKAVWLSSTYYLDPAIASLPHADAERLFTRALAYCGNAETRGFVPKSVLKTFGIRAVSRRVSDLINAGIWVETDTDPTGGNIPGYQFKAWQNWNQSADDLLERRKHDRERQRRAREKRAQQTETMSRDNSRDVTPPEESREEESTKYVPTAASVGNARDLPGRPVAVNGWRLVRDRIPDTHPQPTRTALANEAAALLHAGTPTEDVEAALDLWNTKPGRGARLLPHLVSDVIRARTQPTTQAANAGDAKIQGWLDIGARLIAEHPDNRGKELTA